MNNTTRFLLLGNGIFCIQAPLFMSMSGDESLRSFRNLLTFRFLRHYKNRLIEDNFSDTEIFRQDASFRLKEFAPNHITLSCINEGMENCYVFYDALRDRHVIRQDAASGFFLFSLEEVKVVAHLLQRLQACETKLEQIIGEKTPKSISSIIGAD